MFKIHRCELLRAFLNLRERIQKFYLVDALIFYSINLNEGSVLSLRMAEETKKDWGLRGQGVLTIWITYTSLSCGTQIYGGVLHRQGYQSKTASKSIILLIAP